MTKDSDKLKDITPEDSAVPVYLEPLTDEEIALGKQWEAEAPARERAAVENARRAAYAEIADPLFFKYQAGEATKEEWLAARAEVNASHPYPEEAPASKKASKK